MEHTSWLSAALVYLAAAVLASDLGAQLLLRDRQLFERGQQLVVTIAICLPLTSVLSGVTGSGRLDRVSETVDVLIAGKWTSHNVCAWGR